MEIEFNNVVYETTSNIEKPILKGMSFKLENSKIYAFLGNSNSGKTSIGELISALITPTKGYVKVGNFINNGRKIKNVNSLRSEIGYVFQNPQEMFITKTVKSEIQFGMKYFKYKLSVIEKRTRDSLMLVGLEESILNRRIDSLSLSEQKKLSIASTLAYNPKVLILDEPTIGLNEREKKDLIRLIRIMKNKYNRTVIILTKDTDFIYRTSDYIYIIEDGNIIKEGTKEILTEIKFLEEHSLYLPKCLKFINLAKTQKNADLEYYDDVKELIKGVYRNVS